MEVIKSFADNEREAKIRVNNNPLIKPENIIIGTWIWYSIEDRLLVSDGFSKIAGISKNSNNDFYTFFDIVHDNDLVPFLKVIDLMLKGASPQWINFRIFRPDKTIQKVNCFIESMTTEFEEIFDITGVCFKGFD